MKVEIKNKSVTLTSESKKEAQQLLNIVLSQFEEKRTEKKTERRKYKRQVSSDLTRCKYCNKKNKGMIGKKVHESRCPKKEQGLDFIQGNEASWENYEKMITELK